MYTEGDKRVYPQSGRSLWQRLQYAYGLCKIAVAHGQLGQLRKLTMSRRPAAEVVPAVGAWEPPEPGVQPVALLEVEAARRATR